MIQPFFTFVLICGHALRHEAIFFQLQTVNSPLPQRAENIHLYILKPKVGLNMILSQYKMQRQTLVA